MLPPTDQHPSLLLALLFVFVFLSLPRLIEFGDKLLTAAEVFQGFPRPG